MSDLTVLGGLFASAFLSATVLPGTSEAALLALVAMGSASGPALVATATAGNLLGSLLNWLVGRGLSRYRGARWFPVSEASYGRACRWFGRWGVWSLLLAWLPLVGDGLTLAAGALGVRVLPFVLLVGAGKGARYAAVAAGGLWFAEG